MYRLEITFRFHQTFRWFFTYTCVDDPLSLTFEYALFTFTVAQKQTIIKSTTLKLFPIYSITP